MKGDVKVLEILNEALESELTAINQYSEHAAMCRNWGLDGLAKALDDRTGEEHEHSRELMDRILFLDGKPSVNKATTAQAGSDPKQQMAINLKSEVDAVKLYNRGIKVASECSDNTTRALLEHILGEEEKHIDYIQGQIYQIQHMGYENWLAQQLEA